MNYRALQAELKARGLNAKGSKKELEARYAEWKEGLDGAELIEAVTEAIPPVKKSPIGRKFIFTGDPVGRCDPEFCQMHGLLFKLNGAGVHVSDEIAAKLATHSHFTESK